MPLAGKEVGAGEGRLLGVGVVLTINGGVEGVGVAERVAMPLVPEIVDDGLVRGSSSAGPG